MDMKKGMKEAIGAPDAQIPIMAGEISDLSLLVPAVIDGGVTAANMNPTGKKSLMCWLIVAGSVMILTNYIQAAPLYQLIPVEPIMVIFTMFVFAIFFVFHTTKQI